MIKGLTFRFCLVLIATLTSTVVFSYGSIPSFAISSFQVLPCNNGNSTNITITQDTLLTPNCIYYVSFSITTSNVIFNCRGATIDGLNQSNQNVGILITTPYNSNLSNVTVENCNVEGFVNGILVNRSGYQSLTNGDYYVNYLSDIYITHNFIEKTENVGVYVGPYVTKVTIQDNKIYNCGSTGIYLDSGSNGNQILNNQIIHNGYSGVSPQGKIVSYGGVSFRIFETGREGLAIDGSYNNIIQSNTFVNNSAGAIFIYKNCGEDVNSNPQAWIPRVYASNNNLIEDNTLSGSGTGVWIGSRMSQNLYLMDCSEPAYFTGFMKYIALDHASGNVVENNSFTGFTYGIRVEANSSKIIGNSFFGDSLDNYAVIVGTPYRTQILHEPVANTILENNVSNLPNPSPYRYQDGEINTTFKNNISQGIQSGWCESPDVPIDPFIFIYAFELASTPVGSQPPPIPTLGQLPPCQATSAPRNLTASLISSTLKLTWLPPADLGNGNFMGYNLYIGESPNPLLDPLFTTTDNNYLNLQVSSFTSGKTYYVYLRAVNTAGISDISNIASVNIGTVLPPVQEVTITNIGTNSATVNWLNDTEANNFPVIQYDLVLSDLSTSQVTYYSTNMNFYDLYNLDSNTSYSVIVYAVNAIGSSLPSVAVNFKTAGYVRPNNLVVSPLNTPSRSSYNQLPTSFNQPSSANSGIKTNLRSSLRSKKAEGYEVKTPKPGYNFSLVVLVGSILLSCLALSLLIFSKTRLKKNKYS